MIRSVSEGRFFSKDQQVLLVTILLISVSRFHFTILDRKCLKLLADQI